MLTDIQIAQESVVLPITKIANDLNVKDCYYDSVWEV